MGSLGGETQRPLAGLHALITGGGGGIGAATAIELAGMGVNLSLVGRRIGPLREQSAKISELYNVKCHYRSVDVTQLSEVNSTVAEMVDLFGQIQILINNVGAAESAPFRRTDATLLDHMMKTNFYSAFYCTQAVLPGMRAKRWGRIINVASAAGVKGYPYVTAYCSAKHALIGFTRALAKEVGSDELTVNAVCPGFVDTDLVDRAARDVAEKARRSPEDVRAEYAAQNPGGRLIAPTEVATTIAWLCLPAMGAINGQAIVVAGGEP